jgi:hypothetical protein
MYSMTTQLTYRLFTILIGIIVALLIVVTVLVQAELSFPSKIGGPDDLSLTIRSAVELFPSWKSWF